MSQKVLISESGVIAPDTPDYTAFAKLPGVKRGVRAGPGQPVELTPEKPKATRKKRAAKKDGEENS